MNDKLYKYNNINFIIEIFESQKFIIRPLPEKCQWFNLPVIISFYYIYLDKKKYYPNKNLKFCCAIINHNFTLCALNTYYKMADYF